VADYTWDDWSGFPEGEELHDMLLATAAALLDDGHFGAAVVSAQTACEVLTENVMHFWISQILITGGGSSLWRDLGESLMDLFQTFTLTNERLLRVYVLISDDSSITEQPFWNRYKELVKRRHRVVHRGSVSTHAEAAQSIAVAKEFVAHIKGTLPRSSDSQEGE
jgi:hypothetical protein